MLSTGIHPDEPTPQHGDGAPDEQISAALLYDTAKAVDFLCDLRPNGRVAVAAIVPDGALIGATFMLPLERAQLTAWISTRQGVANLHFRHNEPVEPADQRGKAGTVTKADIALLHGVPVDLDPREAVETTPGGFASERQRLQDQIEAWGADDDLGPSVIIDSGNGAQAVWLFAEPLPATPENIAAVEAQGKALARRFGGDAVHSVEHLLRIPHTINLPHANKRAKGRVPAATRGKVLDAGRRYSRAALARIAPPLANEPASTGALDFDPTVAWDALGDPDRLNPSLAASVASACAARPAFARLLYPDGPVTDRSERDFAIASECVRAGIIDMADVAAVIAAYSPDKFQDKAEHGDAQAVAYLGRTIARALERVSPIRPEAYFDVIEDNDGAASAANAAFGEPIDLFGDDDPAELSAPESECLPSVIEELTRTVAVEMGVPPSFVAVPAVAALAAAIGNSLKLYPREHSTTWQVSASFPVVIIAEPGRKKSPTLRTVLAPHRKIERELRIAFAREKASFDVLYRNAKGKAVLNAPSGPKQGQLLIDDATLEKMIQILADNPRGCCVHPDELAAWLGQMGAYKRSGEGDRGTMLKLLDGDEASKDRVSGSVYAESALIGLIASTQPDKMRELARNLKTDGMMQRFIVVVDDGIERRPLDAPTDGAALADYERAVRGMFAIKHTSEGKVYLSPGAREILSETWLKVDALRNLPGASAAWSSHLSKWEGVIYRIALTFHAVEAWSFFGSVPTGPSAPVTSDTARRVSRFVAFLIGHALRFYRDYYEPAQHTAEARNVAGYLLTRPDITAVTPRGIMKVRRQIENKPMTYAVMRDLENAGWVKTSARDGDGPTQWAVNPKIHERFSDHAEREKTQREHKRQQILAAIAAQKELRDAE